MSKGTPLDGKGRRGRDAPRLRAESLWRDLQDLFPRAMTGLPPDEAPLDPAFRRGRHRWLVPRAGTRDHWETVAHHEPYAYLEVAPGGACVGLQCETTEGAETLSRLLDPGLENRLERFVTAAGRFGADAETAVVAVQSRPEDPTRTRTLRGHSCPTHDLSAELVATLIALAMDPPPRLLRDGETVALQVLRCPLDPEDRTAARRTTRRLVDLWSPIHSLPAPKGPPPRKRELEARLRRLYPRTLLLLGSGLDPQALARARIEAKELDRAFREVGGPRPKLLDQVLERLGL